MNAAVTSIDTNVLVRLLTGDDAKQAAAARSLFESGPVWIAKTVLLETNWVLGSLYGFGEDAIRQAFTKLLGLANVNVEDESAVAAALVLNAQGIEFADALHMTSKPDQVRFVSFDRTLIRRARRAGVARVAVAGE